MIQADFNFQLGDPGDWDRLRWFYSDLLRTSVQAYEAGNDQAALRDLLRAQKILCCGNPAASFVKHSVFSGERTDSISSSEAWAAYKVQMDYGVQPRLSQREFERNFKSAMRELLGVAASRSIVRGGKQKNGYPGVRLKPFNK